MNYEQTNRLRIALLIRLHGISEAQATALASLIWGAQA